MVICCSRIRPRLSTFPPCSTAVYKKQSPVEAFTPPIPVSNNCEVPQWARQTLFRNSSGTEAAIIRYHGLADGQVVGEVDVPSSGMFHTKTATSNLELEIFLNLTLKTNILDVMISQLFKVAFIS